MRFNKLQLTIILGFYYIDKAKNIEAFTIKFNKYFHLSVSRQTILFALTQFKNINPANNNQALITDDKDFARLWEEYIVFDKIASLKELYKLFKQEKYLNEASNLTDISESNTSLTRNSLVLDVPVEKPLITSGCDKKVYPRLKEVAGNSLCLAEYKCENPLCSITLFTRKDGTATYTEAHHLIPLCYQNDFEYSLDVEANVVSLCPHCHRLLHYGQDKENLLKNLYNDRIARLKKCKLDISYESLLLMYR